MTTHRLQSRLRPFVLMLLAICPSCGVKSTPPAASTQDSVETATRPPGTMVPPFQHASAGRADPCYRPPDGFSELQAIAGEVAQANGRKILWHLQPGANPGPLVRIRGNLDDCTIYIHPIAARKVPPNTWAFLFGHEFAHLSENLGTHSATSPANELNADISGARHALAAGYRIEAFLGWVLTEPNQRTVSHGALHDRVQSIAAHFGVPQRSIQQESQRASRYRATH